jgi:7-carboxy-7-deazaguanine synthase
MNALEQGASIPVMEHFYTIQGEGAYSGHAAYFIRLGGCDVGCHWCDVKESWDAEAHPKMTITSLLSEAENQPARLVVITGGEPLMHQLDGLTSNFRSKGFRTHIETSGAHPLSGTWDWITFSPKKFKEGSSELASLANELKIVIFNKTDFEFALEWSQKVSAQCLLYLQPEWDRREEMMPLITEFVKNNPQWRVSLQAHKYLNIP